MNQHLLYSQEIKVFLRSLSPSYEPGNIGKNSTLRNFHGCKRHWRRAKILDEITKDISHRTMKNMLFLTG